jgi:hypothetical protein
MGFFFDMVIIAFHGIPLVFVNYNRVQRAITIILSFDLILMFFRAIPKQDFVEEIVEETQDDSNLLMATIRRATTVINPTTKANEDDDVDIKVNKLKVDIYNRRFADIMSHHLGSLSFWLYLLSIVPILVYDLKVGWPMEQ